MAARNAAFLLFAKESVRTAYHLARFLLLLSGWQFCCEELKIKKNLIVLVYSLDLTVFLFLKQGGCRSDVLGLASS